MDQTPERDESFKDGTIYCIDLAHHEGHHIAATLQHSYEEVAKILRSRNGNLEYLLVLIPTNKPGEASAMLAKPAALIDGLSIIHARSKDFGDNFEIIVVPTSSHVAELWKTVCSDA